jgi:hypothetical protein
VQVQVSLTPGVFSAAPVTANVFLSTVSVGPLVAQVTGSTGSTAVTWSVLEGSAGGSLSPGPTPMFIPSIFPGFYHAVATSVADPNVSAQVSVQRLAGVNLVPAAATLETGATLPFTVITNPVLTATVSASGGTFAAGPGPGQWLYTAPGAAGTYTITALSSIGTTATATVTVIPPVQVTVTPTTVTMTSGSSYPLAATVTGNANTDVTWTLQEGAAGGSISSGLADGNPVYTAPAAAGTYHLVATSVADPTRSAVLTVTVQAGDITINPPNPAILTGGTVAFQAFAAGNPAVVWSVPAGPAAGSVDSLGNYTAPGAPGSYVVLAAAGGLSASATVVVLTTNFSGDGKPFMNSADLAILADAWGSSPGMANWNPLCDLNQDGVVNDGDVTLFFTQFGGLP